MNYGNLPLNVPTLEINKTGPLNLYLHFPPGYILPDISAVFSDVEGEPLAEDLQPGIDSLNTLVVIYLDAEKTALLPDYATFRIAYDGIEKIGGRIIPSNKVAAFPQSYVLSPDGTDIRLSIYDLESVNMAREYRDQAGTSAAAAATSAANAATSETNAANSAANAATSETNAANSAANAATSETNAANSATAANNSKNAAATSAANAATSETNAANSATAANTSKNAAATSAANAATSETNAANSATAANSSKEAAAISEANALASKRFPWITEATAARTLALTDVDKAIRCTYASAVTITVPNDSTVIWPTDVEIIFCQAGAGQLTFTGGAGVTINSSETLKTAKQYAYVGLKKVSANVWDLTGERQIA